MRHRLVPTRRGPDGWYPAMFVEGAQEALEAAVKFHAETGVPVLVCEDPEDRGTGRQLATVGGEGKRRRR